MSIYVQREVKGRWRTRDGLKDQKGTTVIARQTSSPHTFPFSLNFLKSLFLFGICDTSQNIVRRGERGCSNAHPPIQSKPHFDKKVKFKGKKFFTTLKEFQNFTESPGFQKKCKFDQTLISSFHQISQFDKYNNTV